MNPSATDLVLWSILTAFGSTALTVIIRSVPGINKLVADNKKPWACNVCMPLYTTAALVAIPIYQTGQWGYAVALLPAYAGAYGMLEHLSQLAPPAIPSDLFDANEDSES